MGFQFSQGQVCAEKIPKQGHAWAVVTGRWEGIGGSRGIGPH